MVDEFEPLIEFTADDRCDGCGAQAFALATREGTTDLLFCIHHLKKSNDNLLDEGWKIVEDYAAMENLVRPSYYPIPV